MSLHPEARNLQMSRSQCIDLLCRAPSKADVVIEEIDPPEDSSALSRSSLDVYDQEVYEADPVRWGSGEADELIRPRRPAWQFSESVLRPQKKPNDGRVLQVLLV